MKYLLLFTIFLIGCHKDKPEVISCHCQPLETNIVKHFKVTKRLESPKAAGESHDHYGDY